MVDRPASVIKELLENSIDAGATQIDLTIEGGGIQLIAVRDNGGGILKEDLNLALEQHATSKIATAQDLAQINSLGFRGEALASIASVSRLQIMSNTADQEHGWRVTDTQITPVAHPVGTTVEMRDLFYNLPARRKFLRSARTEYLYAEELFRRIALSRFDIAFSLRNQQKLLKNLPRCQDAAAQLRRINKLCGKRQDLLFIDAEQNGMRLWGWLGAPANARNQEPHQYFFINGRIIRDRLINHAVRQIYQPLCAPGTLAFYCLYLELDPIALDVNVHPTKHEVRFRDPRVVHAFITEILRSAVGEPTTDANNVAYLPSVSHNGHAKFKVLTTLGEELAIAEQDGKLWFLDLTKVPSTALGSLQNPQFRHYWRELQLARLRELLD